MRMLFHFQLTRLEVTTLFSWFGSGKDRVLAKIHQSVQKDFISLSLTSSQRHRSHFFNAVIAFFRSVNNLDAEGLSLLSREEQRIHTKHTNGNLTANCFNSQNENQPPHCRLNGFSAALKTRPRASSLLWADPSQTATPLLRISSEGAKIKRALFCCDCVCRVCAWLYIYRSKTFSQTISGREKLNTNFCLGTVSVCFIVGCNEKCSPSCSSSSASAFLWDVHHVWFFLLQQTRMVPCLSRVLNWQEIKSLCAILTITSRLWIHLYTTNNRETQLETSWRRSWKNKTEVKQSELKWTLIHQVDQRVIKACRVCK